MLCFQGCIQLPADKDRPGGSQDTSSPKKIVLNSADDFFSELRDKNFISVGNIVSRKAKQITAEFDVSWFIFLCFLYRLLFFYLYVTKCSMQITQY